MHKAEDGQMLRQGPGPGEQGLEDSVGHGGRYRLGQQAMQCCPAGLAGKSGHHGRGCHPELPVVGGGRKPPEKVVVVSTRQIRYMPHEISIEPADDPVAVTP
jgi:hypothetical protein